MRLKYALAFGLSLAAFSFAADVDSKYLVKAENFRIGEEIKLDVMTAIGEPDQKVRSIAPSKVDNQHFYMRRKIDGKVYGIYEGKLNPDPYRHFYAFDLESNMITMQEAMRMKFYGKRRTKPYRDEPELYFDSKHIYSPHVPVLYFMKNGEWERIEAVLAPGVVSLSSSNPFVLVKHSDGKTYELPQMLFPVDAGFYYAEFNSEGFFPFVDAFIVNPNKVNTLRVNPTKSIGQNVEFRPHVQESQIVAADTLERLEAYYDIFRKDSLAVLDTLSAGTFEQVYTPKKSFENVDSLAYAEYSRLYDSLYNVSLDIWNKTRFSPILAMSNLFANQFAKFEQGEYKFSFVPTEIQVYKHAVENPTPVQPDSVVTDSFVVDSLTIAFKSADGRRDFKWQGSVEGFKIDTALQGGVQVVATLENNKPVWILQNDTVVARKHYRYTSVDFLIDGHFVRGVGSFILPLDVLNEKEVQDWLHPVKEEKAAVAPEAEKTVVVKDSLVTAPEWGEVVRLDSASFRYHGKVVGISGFFIQTKEVGQQEYRNNIVTYHLKQKDRSTYEGGERPVHNITWTHAREYCQAIGGDLPTEAQWEYAARAGGNDGYIWEAMGGEPKDYAVYYKNAGKDQNGPLDRGSRKPNAWGIYDMAGNVSEWTRDSYSWFSFYDEDVNPTGALLGYTKVIKGGSFDDKAKDLNATIRKDEDPRYWAENIGFRCMFPLSAVKKIEVKVETETDSIVKADLNAFAVPETITKQEVKEQPVNAEPATVQNAEALPAQEQKTNTESVETEAPKSEAAAEKAKVEVPNEEVQNTKSPKAPEENPKKEIDPSELW